MTTYSAEPIPSSTVVTTLVDNWDTFEGNIPQPEILDINVDHENAVARFDLTNSDLLIVKLDTTGIQETWRDAYKYGDNKSNVEILLYTKESRQRLYDLVQEVRRIFRVYKHTFSGFQLARYNNFSELNQAELNFWQGIIRITLENAGVYINGS